MYSTACAMSSLLGVFIGKAALFQDPLRVRLDTSSPFPYAIHWVINLHSSELPSLSSRFCHKERREGSRGLRVRPVQSKLGVVAVAEKILPVFRRFAQQESFEAESDGEAGGERTLAVSRPEMPRVSVRRFKRIRPIGEAR